MPRIKLPCVLELRFKHEVQAVNADKRVKSLKSALEEARTNYEKLKKVCCEDKKEKARIPYQVVLKSLLLLFLQDFDAFKDHSNSLLTKERELNKILRHLRS